MLLFRSALAQHHSGRETIIEPRSSATQQTIMWLACNQAGRQTQKGGASLHLLSAVMNVIWTRRQCVTGK